jgi:hypothetical protein
MNGLQHPVKHPVLVPAENGSLTPLPGSCHEPSPDNEEPYPPTATARHRDDSLVGKITAATNSDFLGNLLDCPLLPRWDFVSSGGKGPRLIFFWYFLNRGGHKLRTKKAHDLTGARIGMYAGGIMVEQQSTELL